MRLEQFIFCDWCYDHDPELGLYGGNLLKTARNRLAFGPGYRVLGFFMSRRVWAEFWVVGHDLGKDWLFLLPVNQWRKEAWDDEVLHELDSFMEGSAEACVPLRRYPGVRFCDQLALEQNDGSPPVWRINYVESEFIDVAYRGRDGTRVTHANVAIWTRPTPEQMECFEGALAKSVEDAYRLDGKSWKSWLVHKGLVADRPAWARPVMPVTFEEKREMKTRIAALSRQVALLQKRVRPSPGKLPMEVRLSAAACLLGQKLGKP